MFSIFGMFGNRRFTSAIILAGGSSTRMGGDTTKQFMMLAGKPIIVRTLEAFQKSPLIDEIIVVSRSDENLLYRDIINERGISKITKVVSGGRTRQESALCGVEAVSKKSRYIVIHDGARPLVTTDIIKNVCESAYNERAAVAGTTSKDTVKLATEKGYAEKTLDRDKVWLIQTPQAFYKPLYEAAAYSAVKDGIDATDDASLLEKYFYKVKLVNCGNENIKITTPVDLLTAESILKKRGKGR